jgi:hypothetical protein
VGVNLALAVSSGVDRVNFDRFDPWLGGTKVVFAALDQTHFLGIAD